MPTRLMWVTPSGVQLRPQFCPDHSVAFAASSVLGNLDGELHHGTAARVERDRWVIERGPGGQVVLRAPIDTDELTLVHAGGRRVQRDLRVAGAVVDNLNSAFDHLAGLDLIDDVGARAGVVGSG